LDEEIGRRAAEALNHVALLGLLIVWEALFPVRHYLE
jgi:hypothetical protein